MHFEHEALKLDHSSELNKKFVSTGSNLILLEKSATNRMLKSNTHRERFKNLIHLISESECSIIEPALHSCIVTIGEELRVLRFGPGQEDFYVEMYAHSLKASSMWGLTDIILGYKVRFDHVTSV